MDIESLRERMNLVLAQADAENGGNATNEQRVDALLNVIGLAKTPERVRVECANPRFGRPGEYPRQVKEAATLSDLIALLIAELAAVGDIPVVTRGRCKYTGGIEQSAVWRRVDEHAKDSDKRFDWGTLIYNDEQALTKNDVDLLPEGTLAFILETEG